MSTRTRTGLRCEPWESLLFLLWLTCRANVGPTRVNAQGPAPSFVVCTVPRPPMSMCTPSSNSSALFSGLSIETFREVAEDALDWQEGEQYTFTCLESGTSTTIYERVLPEDGGCDAFIASTTITAERTAAGVQWAYPYWSGSISAVVQNTEKNTDGWAWTRPFTWQLWLALGLTSICLPLVIFILEVLSIKRRVSLRDSARGYHESLWRTLWVLIQGETMAVTNLAARVTVIILAFSSLILSASYTANLAAFLTLKSYGSLNRIEDLQGTAVSTVEAYQPRFASRYGIKTLLANITGPDSIIAEAGDVLSGQLIGWLHDTEVAQYYVATWPGCELRLLDQRVEPFEYGLAFSPFVDSSIVDAFSLSILRLIEDGTIPQIGDTFLLSDSPCLNPEDNESEIAQLSFGQVYGLWVLLAAGVLVGLVLMMAKRWLKSHRNPDWGRPGAPKFNRTASLETSESDMARTFERGDSREVRKSDLERVETHLVDR